jgi:hypothetical protein
MSDCAHGFEGKGNLSLRQDFYDATLSTVEIEEDRLMWRFKPVDRCSY